MLRSFLAAILVVTIVPAGAVAAQVVPPPVSPTDPSLPVPAPTPAPDPTPSPVVPTPLPTASPTPAPMPSATPSPRASPSPVATPAATPSPEPAAAPAEVGADVQPTPTATSAALPGAVSTRVDDGASENGDGGGGWLLWGGIALVVVAVLTAARAILPRRRRDRDAGAAEASRDMAMPESVPATPVPLRSAAGMSAPAAHASVPTIGYRPTRIGLNLVSMTVDGEVAVANQTGETIEAIRVRASVLGAAAGHKGAVAAVHREPAGRLAAPPFALAPEQARAVRLIAAASRDRIDALTVSGRPMVVPLVAVTVDWRDAAGEHRRTQAFAVGIERVDSAKLSPVWLDQDARTFDAVAARPHGDPIG